MSTPSPADRDPATVTSRGPVGAAPHTTACDIARAVGVGDADPREVLERHAARIARENTRVGAFEHLDLDAARRAAEAVAALAPDARARLPLAGVPIAIKDNVPVAGLPMRVGSRATPAAPARADHVVVARLRAAGAVIVGTTRLPELGLWGTSDGADGIARSPWAPDRSAGGSSGGSAAAVAAGMVPIAHGNDGLGSIRIPAACCGLVGIKPGRGVVPAELAVDSWFGLAENGALATTVADAALLLGVLAGDPTLGIVRQPSRALRIGLALRPPAMGFTLDRGLEACTRDVADALARMGHDVVEVAPAMPSPWQVLAVLATWAAGAARAVDEELPAGSERLLQPRTRRHARLGRLALRLGMVRPRDREAWRARMIDHLAPFDLVLTPTLAQLPLAAVAWSERGWLANLVANLRFAPYCGPVNFAGLPALALPAGVHPSGVPASAHLVGPPGSERLLLGVASQVEAAHPWPRTAAAAPSGAAHGVASGGTVSTTHPGSS